jgi:hypothetical protein
VPERLVAVPGRRFGRLVVVREAWRSGHGVTHGAQVSGVPAAARFCEAADGGRVACLRRSEQRQVVPADRADLNCPPRLGLPEDVRRVGLRLRRDRSVAAVPCPAGLTAVIGERR